MGADRDSRAVIRTAITIEMIARPQGITAQELAPYIDATPSSAMRILRTLEASGFAHSEVRVTPHRAGRQASIFYLNADRLKRLLSAP